MSVRLFFILMYASENESFTKDYNVFVSSKEIKMQLKMQKICKMCDMDSFLLFIHTL